MQGYPPRLLALCERCPQSMLNRDYWSIKDFVLVKEVGSGAASTVYYAICRKSTQPVAIKMYLKSKLSKLNRRQVEREINIHSSLNHPHIIDFYAAFEDDDRIYLVQEYAAGGDLFDDVKRRGGRLPEREVVQQILYPYLMALSYLHARGIIHRDIKPENTVFTRERVLKVTDFGLAISACTERPVTRLGTLDYMAPEVLRCPDKHSPEDNKDRVDLEYDASVDAWAMGVLAYELIVGRPPFGMSCREATMRAIVAASPSIPDWMSPAAADFIRSALQRTSARRLPVDVLLQHPWIASHVVLAAGGSGTAAAAFARPFQAATALARNLSCGAEAAAALAAAAQAGASVGSAAAFASIAAAAGVGSAGSSRSLFFPPGGQYKHLAPQLQGCNSASASELGGGGGAAAAAAVLMYDSDQRPSKRQVHRCQSAFLDGPAGGGTAATAALTPPGLMAQHGVPLRLYDNMSYWMTDGNGFSRDPLFGLGGGGSSAQQLLQLQQPVSVVAQQQQAVVAAAAVMAAAAAGGASSPIGSPMAMGRAQDFYQSQLAQAVAGVYGTAQVQMVQEQMDAQALQQQQQQQQLLLLQHQQQHQQQMQAYQYQQQHYQQQLQMQYSQQRQQEQHQQQKQQMAMLVQQQQIQQQQQLLLRQQHMSAADVQLRQHQEQQQGRQDGDSLSGSVESTGGVAAVGGAAAVEPSVPPVTAADYYKLHLEDLRTMWEVGGRTPGTGCRPPPVPRGLCRSFTARHSGRTASSAGGIGGNLAGGSVAAAAVQSPAAARLLRNGSSSSSSGGSMKRRTPDTHDWDLPLLPTALSAQQLQLHHLQVNRAGGSAATDPAAGLRPASPLGRNSDAFAAAGGAAAYYTAGGGGDTAAAANVVTAVGGCPATPFSPYAAMSVAGPTESGEALPVAPVAPLPLPQLPNLQSFTSYGSGSGQRPSRLSKAFRRVDSLDPADGGVGFRVAAPSSQGSDGSGYSGGGDGPPCAAPLRARCSGATAAMAALDQLTLASGASAAAAAAAAAGMNYSTGESAVAAMQAMTCMGSAFAAAAAATGLEADISGGGFHNTLSDSSNGSSVVACTAMTGTSLGGTSGGSAGSSGGHLSASTTCSYGYSAASGSCPSPNHQHRAPSLTTCGAFNSAGQDMAALRLSLPTSLPRLGIPAASGSTTGVRSHPLSSPLVTPWSTPLSSPAAGAARLTRMHSQPPGVPSFNALLDLMEAEGVLTAVVDGTPDGGAVPAAALGGSRGGSLDTPDWAMAPPGGDGGRAEGTTAPMQVDDRGAGGDAVPYLYRSASAAVEQDLPVAALAGAVMATAATPVLPAAVQQMSPEDRWAAAWAAAAGGGTGTGRTVQMAPTTPPSLGRVGSFHNTTIAGAAVSAVHVPSPLGRDQPHQQARAAAMQQHIRNRSLNRFQLEQLGLMSVASSSGAGAVAAAGGVPSPFAASQPISPRAAASDAAAAVAMGSEAIATFRGVGGVCGGGSGGGGSGSGGGVGNRLGCDGQQQQQLSPSSSMRAPTAPPHNNAAAAIHAYGTPFRSYPQYGMGAVQCGGASVASPSPLGLRCSRSRPSNGSSEDTSNVCGGGGAAVAAGGCSTSGSACEGPCSR